MTLAISQMQMLYMPEEDRILFRVNSMDKKEFRFWLTRRYVLLLLGILKKHAELDPDVLIQATSDARQAVQHFKKEQAVQGANFAQTFSEDVEEFPLGENVPLAFKLNYKFQSKGLLIGIQAKSGQGIDLLINNEVNPTLTQLILKAGQKGGWKLGEPEAQGRSDSKGMVIN